MRIRRNVIQALGMLSSCSPLLPARGNPRGLKPRPPVGSGLGAAAVAAGCRPSRKIRRSQPTLQGKLLEGGAFGTQGKLWFVPIGIGWVSCLTPDRELVPVFNCNPPLEAGQDCEPQGTRWHEGELYLTTRHRGILIYDPQTKELKTVAYAYRNQLFEGPNDLDFDAEGNLFFTDPWGGGPGSNTADRTGAV